jgi:uncharacterized membrane protein AbrB (regulator of aidB expression)
LPPRLAEAGLHRIALTLLVAGAAGWLVQSMALPLPLMIGPLFAVAGLRMCDLRLHPLPGGLRAGQWAIGTAPGGVAEMCITAKVLQLGMPLVTLCHVLRVVMLTLAAPWSFGLFRRLVAA